eukprot:Skav220341  [mRNA]  locus=scaffold2224:75782:80389:+ [translate_table: standard]
MACDVGHIDSLLRQYDAHGAMDSLWFPECYNFLVQVQERILTEDDLTLKVMQMSPEGYGCVAFGQPHLHIPCDTQLQDMNVQVVGSRRIPPVGAFCWMRKLKEGDTLTNYVFDVDSLCMPITNELGRDRPIHYLELYSGGFGGWQSAASFLTDRVPDCNIHTVAVEHDLKLATSYALTHGSNLIHTSETLPVGLLETETKWVICDDVHSSTWHEAVSHWGVDICSVSAPCPPWSGASTSPGLESPTGRLLMQTLLECRHFRPHILLLEQVPGFSVHPHKVQIEQTLHMCGYRIFWQKTLNTSEMLMTSRPRWLGVAIRIHSPFFPVPVPPFSMNVKPKENFKELFSMSIAERNEMYLGDEEVSIASDRAFLSRPTGTNMTPQEVLATRIYDSDMVTPTFMARYGSQHLLPRDFLRTHKFYAHYCKDDLAPSGCRHWHPKELAIKHGLTGCCFLWDDHEDSWLLLGNMVTPVQALVPLAIGISQLIPGEVDIQELLRDYQIIRLSADEVTTEVTGHGYFLVPKEGVNPLDQLQGIDDLIARVMADIPGDFVWKVNHGLVGLHDYQPMRDVVLLQSPITIEEISDEDVTMATAAFAVSLKGALKLEQGDQIFWFTASIPYDHLSSPWGWTYAAQSSSAVEIGAAQVELHPLAIQVKPDPMTVVPIVILLDGEVTITAVPSEQPLMQHSMIRDVTLIPHDQFGPITESQHPNQDTMIMSSPLLPGSADFLLPVLLAAWQQCQKDIRWSPSTDSILITLTGDSVARVTASAFLCGILSNECILGLGRTIEETVTDDQTQILFSPSRTSGVCPMYPFVLAVAVQASRQLFGKLNVTSPTDADSPVRVMWHGRPLWVGYLPNDLTIHVLEELLKIAMLVACGDSKFRLICSGRRVMPESVLGDCPKSDHSIFPQCISLHVVMQMHGGGPSKTQQKNMQQNALATLLLEQGYTLDWVTSTCDKLVNKIQLSKLQNVTGLPMGHKRIQAVHELIESVGVSIPSMPPNAARTKTMGVAWNKGKKPKVKPDQIDTNQLRVAADYFFNADDIASSQIHELRPQTTGIFLTTPDVATPWLRANQLVSSDELGLLVVGSLPVSTDLEHDTVKVPCYTATDQMVLLTCELVQLGTKRVQCKKTDKVVVPPDETTLLALTVFKSDWPGEQWLELLSATMGTIKKILAADGLDDLVAIWGRSLRAGQTPASPAQAESIQVHATLPTKCLAHVLQKSGFNRIFATPKLQNGRLDVSFKVVWVADTSAAAGFAARVSSHRGLVRGRNTVGLRVVEAEYESSWKMMFPDSPVPAKLKGDVVWKCDGLPFGTSQQTMEAWLRTLPWQATPFRAIGPQGWLLRSDDQPPQGVIMFNSSPVLLRALPPRTQQRESVILGPKVAAVTNGKTKFDPFTLPDSDPWAGYTGTSSNATKSNTIPRSIDGPTENRLQAQDERIASLQSNVQQLQETVKQNQIQIQEQVATVEKHTSSSFSKVASEMGAMRKEFHGAMQSSLQQNTKMMDEKMDEIKQLLVSSNRRDRKKRDKAEDGDESMSS